MFDMFNNIFLEDRVTFDLTNSLCMENGNGIISNIYFRNKKILQNKEMQLENEDQICLWMWLITPNFCSESNQTNQQNIKKNTENEFKIFMLDTFDLAVIVKFKILNFVVNNPSTQR